MKILLTGASGMLANDVIPELVKGKNKVTKTDINKRLPDIQKLDVRELNEVMKFVKIENPDYIFHFAWYHNNIVFSEE